MDGKADGYGCVLLGPFEESTFVSDDGEGMAKKGRKCGSGGGSKGLYLGDVK
jgi:hypothetical protein